MKLNNSLIKIKDILNVREKYILKFYEDNYPRKKFFLKKNWKWLYRINFSKYTTPKIFLINKQIISHAGHIPFYIKIKEKKYLASWFVDFLVIRKYQKKKLGRSLAKIWMKNIDIGITFCNKKSLKVFKNNNWNTDVNFFSTIIPINPFKLKEINNLFPDFFNKFFFFFLCKFNKIDKGEDIISFYNLSNKNINKLSDENNSLSKSLKPFRDKKYLKWRISESPFKNQYLIASLKNKKQYFLIKKSLKNKNMYLEILMKPKNINNYYLRSFLLEISKWAYKNNYVYIKFLIDEKSIKNLNLFLIYKRKLNFAFFFKKKKINTSFQFDLIDSDFEFTNF